MKTFVKTLPDKFRTDVAARRRLLQVGNLDFENLSIQFNDGERQTTMELSADRVPSFTYILSSQEAPKDDEFYTAVLETVDTIGPGVGVIVGGGWQTRTWQSKAASLRLPLPTQKVLFDDSQLAGA